MLLLLVLTNVFGAFRFADAAGGSDLRNVAAGENGHSASVETSGHGAPGTIHERLVEMPGPLLRREIGNIPPDLHPSPVERQRHPRPGRPATNQWTISVYRPFPITDAVDGDIRAHGRLPTAEVNEPGLKAPASRHRSEGHDDGPRSGRTVRITRHPLAVPPHGTANGFAPSGGAHQLLRAHAISDDRALPPAATFCLGSPKLSSPPEWVPMT